MENVQFVTVCKKDFTDYVVFRVEEYLLAEVFNLRINNYEYFTIKVSFLKKEIEHLNVCFRYLKLNSRYHYSVLSFKASNSINQRLSS